jgi:ABC-type tungstate transport system substrate-binding protein
MNDTRKTWLAALSIALGVWLIMMVLDVLLRHKGPLSDFSLFRGNEGMFRMLLLAGFLSVGVFIARSLATQKRTEASLQEAVRMMEVERAKSDAIIAAIGDGISIQELDYKVLYQNAVHRGMLGDHVG